MSMSALSVMVVEADGATRRLALRLLHQLGVVDVTDSADAKAALAQLGLRRQPPDVVMIDLDLPGMDGIEFIGHVAHRGLAPAVLLVSALEPALLDTVQAMTRAFGLHVLGSIEKPLTIARLAEALGGYDLRLHPADADPVVQISATEIRAALGRGEIGPWFQPQVEFSSGKPVAVEALARWVRTDGQVVRPDHFIGLLEREGLADPMTDLILEQSCRHKRTWERQGLRLGLSVNISATTLVDPTAADRYQRIVTGQGVEPSEVVLELTESAVMVDPARSLGVLARLRLKGFGLAIDDFGTGYSSLSQLSQIPFTELKIDQGFVAGAYNQPRQRAMVEASIDLARKLGLQVVAEGVATLEDWRMLAGLGCGLAQGHLIAPPVAPAELPSVLAQWRRPQ